MKTIFDEAGKAVLEHDPQQGVYVMHWYAYQGAHYRRAVQALLEAVKKTRARAYISDASRPTDVQSQDDLKWIATVSKQLAEAGVTDMVVVMPASAIARMGARRLGTTMTEVGVRRHEVASLDEAWAVVKKLPKAA